MLHLILWAVLLLSPSPARQPASDSLSVKIGQMLMTGFRGMSTKEAPEVVADIEHGRIGGVILFDYDLPLRTPVRNIESAQQLQQLTRSLQTHAEIPLFIAIDQEGGKVCRLKPSHGFPSTPSAARLGHVHDPDSTYRSALRTAATLRDLHINMNFAPVLDLAVNKDNPVIAKLERSFSEHPITVTLHARQTIDAMHRNGILTAVKHFPGHGSSRQDTHLGFTDVTGTWDPEELEPYRRLLQQGYNDLIMTAHVYNGRLDPKHPATLSQHTLQGLLRDSLGFRGAIVSDDMQMQAIAAHYSLEEAIRLALDAGVDILLFANNSSYDPLIASKASAIIQQLVNDGKVSRERIDESWKRIMELKQRFNLDTQ
ncbi:glycoside hydrolase family 3 protein [Prosthecochloris sp. CIB 2401]|uniref:glycoside hydrolase family 3 protein n=1 Tax=Prosthecochloris sp. CIB 2401 TaxID=1868325 RepID=UPI00080ABC0B|nr:glycoside hydrolase family 3 protein [Prosthecochloris sp. CIB 2401]ANT65917.1 Beta-hexosaminidase A precursor [Prosthecochloris sp. CIB 2401]